MKRIASFLLAVVVFVASIFQLSVFASSGCTQKHVVNGETPDKFPETMDWGVCMHDPSRQVYSEKNLEEILHLAKKMGVKYIRSELSATNLAWSDKFVSLANKYGIKIICVNHASAILPSNYETDEEFQDALDAFAVTLNMLATRYNGKEGRGKVDYFQIGNETDIALYRATGGRGNGKNPSDYYITPIKEDPTIANLQDTLPFFKTGAKAVRSAGTDAKVVINFCFLRYGPLRYYQEQGVDFDVVGWDWYHNPNTGTAAVTEEMAEELHHYFPKKEIIICETNYDSNNVVYPALQAGSTTRDNPCNWDGFLENLEVLSKKPYIKAICVYEILDQPNNAGGEKAYGLVDCDSGGNIGEPWPIYKDLQARIGGNPNAKRYTVSDINLKPYEKLKVETADDSNASVDMGGEDTFGDFDFSDIGETSNDPQEEPVISDTDETVSDAEPIVEETEATGENHKQNIQDLTTTNTTYKMPWTTLCLSLGGMLLLFALGVLFVIFKPKLFKRSKD